MPSSPSTKRKADAVEGVTSSEIEIARKVLRALFESGKIKHGVSYESRNFFRDIKAWATKQEPDKGSTKDQKLCGAPHRYTSACKKRVEEWITNAIITRTNMDSDSE